MDGKVARPGILIARIAERQHGVVSISQLRRSGISDDAVKARAALGQLHRVHRGVYGLGHLALSPQGRWMAAVLALGGGPRDGGSVLDHWGAAVSHRSALSLWSLLPDNQAPSDVIVGGYGGRAQRAGIRVHRSLSLVSSDVTLHRGIPVTTPSRTIADLREAISTRRSGAISNHELRKAIRQANVLGLPIDRRDAKVRTRSEVETDSYLYHRGEAAFQDDHARDLELMRRGFAVLRLSELQLDEDPARVANVLSTRLALAGDAAQLGGEAAG